MELFAFYGRILGQIGPMVLSGKPMHESIASYAKDHEVDLIVMGSRGLTGLKKKLLGSVSEGVSQNVPCEVIVVK
ncbi:MAG TPA: universal stress protein [Nitrosopumilaceae archaeon]|nr:universal stress protein [Nitrosopumilaceae archaeon]